jgi:Domain of unknown function (DUF4335)
MTRIQRQYSLPNCTLILDGMDDITQSSPMDLRPIMALLLNAECHIGNGYGNSGKPLVGGREFFESLVNAVSLYAQEFLSGVHLPASAYADKPQMVQLKRLAPNQHELSYQPVGQSNPTAQPEKITLSTVQLFDLVEAVDQFVADTQTLPFWSLNLSPVAKKFAPRAAIGKQVIPAALGFSGLAIAAAAMFALPIPQVKQPETLKAGVNTTLTSPPPSPGTSTPPSPLNSPSSSPSAETPSPSTETRKIQADLTAAAPITDPAELERLQKQLKENLTSKIKLGAKIPEALVYRVTVGKDGQIIGYLPQGDVAAQSRAETPLPDLLVVPAADKKPEAIADYQVTFQPGNVIQIKPWGGVIASESPKVVASPEATPTPSTSSTPSTSPSPTASPSASPEASSQGTQEITESAALDDLQPKLYQQIDKAWTTKPAFNEDLTYRVQVNREGTIVGYTPDNRAARDYDNEVPLSKLNKSASTDGTASFKVVFRPSGKLEINPWYGYNKP